MVILGGLEIVAAGYLLNEFNKDKVEARTRRRHKREHDHDYNDDDDRPSSRPSHNKHDSNSLRPPVQAPPRPISAPPIDQGQWQQPPPPYIQQQSNQPPPNARPMPQWQPNVQHIPPFNGNNQPPPIPGNIPRPNTIQSHQQFPQQFNQGPPPPGPGALQRPNTFQPQQSAPSFGPTPGPHLQHPGTFPIQQSQPNFHPQSQQPAKPGPVGPLSYVDKNTGRVYHNLYPPDHPMSRNVLGQDDSELPRDIYFGDKPYDRQLPGDVHTGLLWNEADEDDMAYGKDYSKPRDHARRDMSYERRRDRDRGRSSPPPYR